LLPLVFTSDKLSYGCPALLQKTGTVQIFRFFRGCLRPYPASLEDEWLLYITPMLDPQRMRVFEGVQEIAL
jgi:hypothetical protein